MHKGGYLYILTNKTHKVLYTGVTNNLARRMEEHRAGLDTNSFTHRYNVTILVYFEEYGDIEVAIAREKQLKAGSRKKKIALINSLNPEWRDLSVEFM